MRVNLANENWNVRLTADTMKDICCRKPLTPAIEGSKRATGNVFLDNYVLDFFDVPETVSERDLQE